MKSKRVLLFAAGGLVGVFVLAAPAAAQTQQKPTLQMPQPGVPQIMTLEGMYVRAAYNSEGYVILGYRVANQSVGEE